MSIKTLKIAIVGHGFVGKATEFGFLTPSTEIYTVDPCYGTTIESMCQTMTPDLVFVSVPTPMGSDGTIDSTIIESVFYDIARLCTSHPIVVVKSTVTVDVLHRLENIYDRIVYNPEFLTERNANLDFIHADFLILGGDDMNDLNYVEAAYKDNSRCNPCPVFKVDIEAASMVKYTLNTFMAMKVLFFNQINDIYNKCGTDTPWESFIDIMKADSRVGNTHMSVPGPDGRRGYGGACFPKDTAALIRYARNIEAPITVIEEVVRKNQQIRNQYNDLHDREKSQNVKFDII